MGRAGFLWALSRRLAIFRRNLQHYRGCKAQSGKSVVFYRALWGPFSGSQDLPRVRNGLGITIVSTPKGVLSDAEAREQNVGGEVLAEVF